MDRIGALRERAAEFARVSLANIEREYPYDVRRLVTEPGTLPHRPRDLYPVFFGCMDWHSCVETHWVLVRLLKTVPEQVPVAKIRERLGALLTEDGLAAEAALFRTDPPRGRPYAHGWLLTLHAELSTWDDPDARRWTRHLDPLAEAAVESLLGWLEKADYPIRYGVHMNSAFGLARCLPYARLHPGSGLLEAITAAAQRWFARDTDYPGAWEPSGSDFLSPSLTEAELMAELLPAGRFREWFDGFLPRVAESEPRTLFTPVSVSDDSDGQIAHLHGLNLSRAWGWRRIAETLGSDDPRHRMLLDTAAAHARPELDNVADTHYMVEHWLAAYAVLYLS